MELRISVSDLPADELEGCEFIKVREICDEDELDEAVASGRKVYRTGDGADVEIFDGHEWLVDERPKVVGLPKTEVPTTPYVDQRVDLLQAEVEALTDALLEVDPENATALAVKSRSPDARIALAFDEEADMDEIIASLRGTPVREAR